jgi:hypothetical protein
MQWCKAKASNGSYNLDGGGHKLEYIAKADSASDGDYTIILQGPFRPGDPYSYAGVTDYGTPCKTIEADRDPESTTLWNLSYTFEPLENDDKRKDPTPEAQAPIPWNRPPDIEWANQKKQKIVTEAYRVISGEVQTTKTAVRNSAGAPFASALMRNASLFVLSYTRNERYFPYMNAAFYTDSVNNDQFLDAFAVGLVYCDSITGKWQFENVQDIGPIRYWRVTYKFTYDRDGWDSPVLDRGFVEKVRNVGTGKYELKAIADKNGVPLGREVRLDGNGAALTDQAAADVFLTWRVPPRIPFNNLGIVLPY